MLTTIQEHLLCCNNSPALEYISIFTSKNNDFKLKILESIVVVLDKSVLKKADSPLLLELF